MIDTLLGLGSKIAGGVASSAMQYAFNKRLMKYQYKLNQLSLRESPTAQREGLEAAGYNPMLAVSDGFNMPSVSGSSVSASDFDITEPLNSAKQRKLQEAETNRIELLTDAELEKLKAESLFALANSGAQMYNAETRRLEAAAQIEKTKKETDSINPIVELENKKYGNGFVGEGAKFMRLLKEGLGFKDDKGLDTRIDDYRQVNSAKSVVMNEAARKRQEERRNRVREALESGERRRYNTRNRRH